jgi:hypothetical protein
MAVPNAYHWHPESYQFLGVSKVDESPLEKGVYHYPAYSSSVEPPQHNDNQIVLWDTDLNIWKVAERMEPQKSEQVTKHVDLDPMILLRDVRNVRLAEVDWIVIKAYSLGRPLPQEWAKYFQNLRDLPSISTPTLDSENRLNMSSITWPILPNSVEV